MCAIVVFSETESVLHRMQSLLWSVLTIKQVLELLLHSSKIITFNTEKLMSIWNSHFRMVSKQDLVDQIKGLILQENSIEGITITILSFNCTFNAFSLAHIYITAQASRSKATQWSRTLQFVKCCQHSLSRCRFHRPCQTISLECQVPV